MSSLVTSNPVPKPVLTARTSVTKLAARKDLVRTETLNDRTYMVAPCVPIIEGVHNAEFLSYEEIAVFPEAWDGRPLPIDHPVDSEGKATTAGSPKVMEESVVGFLFNVVARDDIRGISGEIWVDIEKAKTVPGGAEVIKRLQAGTQLEVSTGYYTFVDNTPGEWRNHNDKTVEKFTQKQYGIRPDHLALLPFDLGACSWKDGCGAPRLNEQKEDTSDQTVNSGEEQLMAEAKTDKPTVNGAQLGTALKAALAAHAGADGTSSAMLSRLAEAAGIDSAKIQDLVDGKVDFVPRYWLGVFAAVLDVDPYDLFMAGSNDNMNARYETNTESTGTSNSETVKPDDQKNLTSEENEVAKSHNEAEGGDCEPCKKSLKGQVIAILQSLGLKADETKEAQIENMAETTLTANEQAAAKKARVDALIASDKTQFAENNRDWLMAMNDDQLALLEPKAEAAAPVKEAVAETAAATTAAATNAAVPAKGLSAEEITAIVTNSLKTFAETNPAFQAAQKIVDEQKAQRNEKIAQITANEANSFDKSELETFGDGTLDKILASLSPAHRVAAGVRRQTSEAAVPAAPAILLAKPTKEAK